MTSPSQKKWHQGRIERGERIGGGFFVFRRGNTTKRITISEKSPPFEYDSMEEAMAAARSMAAGLRSHNFAIFQQVGLVRHSDEEA